MEEFFSLFLTFCLGVFGNGESDSTAGIEDFFVLERPIGTNDGVGVNGKLPGKIADGRNHFVGAEGSGGNRKLDLHGNLLIERLRQAGIDFDKHDFPFH